MLAVGVDLQGVGEAGGGGVAKPVHDRRALAAVDRPSHDGDTPLRRIEGGQARLRRLDIAVIDDKNVEAQRPQSLDHRPKAQIVVVGGNHRAGTKAHGRRFNRPAACSTTGPWPWTSRLPAGLKRRESVVSIRPYSTTAALPIRATLTIIPPSAHLNWVSLELGMFSRFDWMPTTALPP